VKLLNRIRAYTFPELLMGLGVTSITLSGLVVGSLTLQRGFVSTEFHVTAQEDQMRVIDFIARDLRRATTATAINNNRRLDLTLPDQTDPLNSLLVRTPIYLDGVIRYGATPISVSYFIEGQDFIRVRGGQRTVLSRQIEEFFAGEVEPGVFEFHMTFTPIYTRTRSLMKQAASRLTTRVCLRNAGRKVQ
jgi:hypothetical protein